jgi:ABC-type transport system involved in multi-copper enzyme maturation permease subunit
MLLLVPSFSLFSMRQVQELAITLSFSCISFILLALSILLGASSIWRDVEKRYTTAVISLPASRSAFIWGKFLAIAIFLVASALLLGSVSVIAIKISAAVYPSVVPIQWGKIGIALAAIMLKYILLSAIAVFFSSLSTSFFLPFFATLAIYLTGSASQDVFEYVSGGDGEKIAPLARLLIKGVYYILPNFSAFNFNLQAIYPLPVHFQDLGYTLAYFIVYTGLALAGANWLFSRRELS